MASLTIRNLSEDTRRALKARAASHNRSMEAEVRDILDSAVVPEVDLGRVWLAATADLRGDFQVPPRSLARDVDLG